jgi:hypothetical protein
LNRTVADSTTQGLAFLALASFLAAFFIARLFTTVNPDVVVVSGGIHFHHFWYGLMMLIAAGWLGIASNTPEYDRVYALVFGLGLGLVGDETGLLLTFGNYQSELTYVVFLAGLSVAVMGILAYRYWPLLSADVVWLGRGERTVHLGIGLSAVSALPFAFDQAVAGATILAGGVAVTVLGLWLHRRRPH